MVAAKVPHGAGLVDMAWIEDTSLHIFSAIAFGQPYPYFAMTKCPLLSMLETVTFWMNDIISMSASKRSLDHLL